MRIILTVAVITLLSMSVTTAQLPSTGAGVVIVGGGGGGGGCSTGDQLDFSDSCNLIWAGH